MKNKKGLIILSSVIVVCAIGLVVSPLLNWPVDKSNAGGDIGKSSRFSRKTATESISNMEELILNDPNYKDGIVTAYMVMQTRAQEFSALVDMSNEVAGDIPEFESVLDEMNKTYVTVNNICASLVRAGENINATLNGEKRPDLAQNTINASLAYTTLQKQNKLATQFIDVTDEYIKTNEASDRLLFVRDQWVDYQRMTAALDGDEKGAEAMEKKGTLLSAEKSVAAMGSFAIGYQIPLIQNANLASVFTVKNSMVAAIPSTVIASIFTPIGNSAITDEVMNNVKAGGELAESTITELSNQLVRGLCEVANDQDFIKAVGWENTVANQAVANQAVANQAVANQAVANQAVANQAVANQAIANQAVANQAVANQAVANQAIANQAIANQAVANQAVANQAVANQAIANQNVVSSYAIGSYSNVVSSFNSAVDAIKASHVSDLANTNFSSQIGMVISNTALGAKAEIKIN